MKLRPCACCRYQRGGEPVPPVFTPSPLFSFTAQQDFRRKPNDGTRASATRAQNVQINGEPHLRDGRLQLASQPPVPHVHQTRHTRFLFLQSGNCSTVAVALTMPVVVLPLNLLSRQANCVLFNVAATDSTSSVLVEKHYV